MSLDTIHNVTDAHISGSTGVGAGTGGIDVEAKDTSLIQTLAGGVGISLGGEIAAAFGVAVAKNTIGDGVDAYVNS